MTVHRRGVRVLAAVLPNARQIAFDIAGIVRHPIERWRQQQHNLCVAPHQMCTNGIHGALGAAGLRRSATARPMTASVNRACIPRSARTREAFHRRNTRADTSCHPRPVPACRPAIAPRPDRSGRDRFVRGARRSERTHCRTVTRNQPSHTLSPRPAWPTRFIPSFQSPEPMSGKPVRAVFHRMT